MPLHLICVSKRAEDAQRILDDCPKGIVVQKLALGSDSAAQRFQTSPEEGTFEVWVMHVFVEESSVDSRPGMAGKLAWKLGGAVEHSADAIVSPLIPSVDSKDPAVILPFGFSNRRILFAVEVDPKIRSEHPGLPRDSDGLFEYIYLADLKERLFSLLFQAKLGVSGVNQGLEAKLANLVSSGGGASSPLKTVEAVPQGFLRGELFGLVGQALGNPSDARVLFEFLHHASHSSSSDDPTARKLFSRSREEVMSAATLARTFAYLASRSFEGRPLVTGVFVPEAWMLNANAPGGHLKFLMKFKHSPSLDLVSPGAAERNALLADGSRSHLVAASNGGLIGIAVSEGASQGRFTARGGYGFLTTHNGGAAFLCCGRPVLHFNGFEWRMDTPANSLRQVADWIAKAAGQKSDFALALTSTIEYLSLHRLASIVVICDRTQAETLASEGVIQSLRSDLDSAEWRQSDLQGFISILRLDGSHFLSTSGEALRVCQKIVVSSTPTLANAGTGTGAAKFLSGKLGENGFVIKVSADGPVRVFHAGNQI